MDALSASLVDCLDRLDVAGRTVVALSGGMDSMVLLDAASRLVDDRPDIRLEALHVHHGLSPNADRWAGFCADECKKRGVPLAVVHVKVDRANTAGQGVEAAARAARYRAFGGCGARFILAAQHSDDQAETVLHQLLRGTGWAGLAGMGEMRELSKEASLVRPFLRLERTDIEAYARERQLAWIEDESNIDAAFTRNYLRHKVMPLIAERFPHYRASLARAARHAAESADMLEALAQADLQWDGQLARAESLDPLPEARQVNALYHWLRWQGVTPPAATQLAEWARQLFRPPPADRAHQAGGHDFLIVRKRDVLALQRLDKGEAA